MRRVLALLLAAAAAGLLASGAGAKTPLPTAPQGTGHEPTAGGGDNGGQTFTARYALAVLDISFDQIEVFIFPKKVACNDVNFATPPYIEVIVDTNGAPIRVGKPSLSNGRAFVQVNFHQAKAENDIQPGASITFTKIGPARNSVWHGRLTVTKQRFQGHTFSYDGTFAATWCGKD